MYLCFGNQLAAAETEMNRLHASLLTIVTVPDLLQKSQDAWLRHRDAECALQFSDDDPRRETPCRLQFTQKRIEQLREITNGDCMYSLYACIPKK